MPREASTASPRLRRPRSSVLLEARRCLGGVVTAAGVSIAMVSVGGCSRGCGGSKPYVPYSIDDGAPPLPSVASAASDDVPVPAPDGGSFAVVRAELAPPESTRWALAGVELTAPEGATFAAALTGDFDGDGQPDAATWVRRPGDGGALLLFRGRGPGAADPPLTVWTAPPLAADCSGQARLEQVGSRTAFVEVRAECARSPRPPRSLAVVSLATGRHRFSASVTDPPAGPSLTFDADGSDADGDGAEDITLRATLEGGEAPLEPGPRVTALLRWFDRPAGLSRDTTEPDASLKATAAAAWARAGRAKDAPFVPVLVQSTRLLYGALCAEGGAPRLVDVVGSPAVPCGASRALEEAGLAEVRAYATQGDVLRGLLALERAQRPPATTTAARAKEVLALLEKASPSSSARSVRELGATAALERGRAPAWGPLAFERGGTLLVRGPQAVVRVDPATLEEHVAEDVPPWKMAVLSPEANHRWIDAYNPCNGPLVHLTFAPTGDGDMHDVAAPVLVPLGARCARAKGEAVAATPIAWGPRGLEALVAGQLLLVPPDFSPPSPLAGFLDQPGGFGSPRSPGGRFVVMAAAHGLALRGERTRLLRAKELDGTYGELRACTVRDDGRYVACVRKGKVMLGEWDAP